jgi:hypothetical protein
MWYKSRQTVSALLANAYWLGTEQLGLPLEAYQLGANINTPQPSPNLNFDQLVLIQKV